MDGAPDANAGAPRGGDGSHRHTPAENEDMIMNKPEDTASIFQHHRLLLFSIAYRMLGNATDAEDIVQDAFLRWLHACGNEVQSPKA